MEIFSNKALKMFPKKNEVQTRHCAYAKRYSLN